MSYTITAICASLRGMRYSHSCQVAVDRGLPMYNVNPDFTVNNAQGGQWYMPGLISKKYEDMGGRVFYFGKPHKVLTNRTM